MEKEFLLIIVEDTFNSEGVSTENCLGQYFSSKQAILNHFETNIICLKLTKIKNT